MNGANKRKKYFPNNWKRFKSVPDSFFEPHLFTDVMDWKVRGWLLPADVYCIIRATNLKNSKVKEYIYKQPKSAEKKINRFFLAQTHSLAITYHDEQQYLGPFEFADDFDDGGNT